MQATSTLGRMATCRAWLRQSFLAIEDDVLRRCALMALAIALQSLLELPRDALNTLIGPKIGLLVMVVQAGSIALMITAVALPSPNHTGPQRPATQRPLPRWMLALALGLAALGAINGVRLTALMVVTSATPPWYSNDGTSLDHFAAIELLRGHDPYETVTMSGAIHALHLPRIFVTPLHRGVFAKRSWLDYPKDNDVRAVFAHTPPGQTPPEIESHVSYPALSFLALVPFVAVGLPNMAILAVLCLLAFAWIALRAVPPDLRLWLGLLILIDMPVLDSVLTGGLDVTVMLLLFVAWLRWRDAFWSTLCFGLALAAKQQPWFFIPFFAIFLWQRVGYRETLLRLGAAGAIFAVINLPFIIHDRATWLAGVLAPIRDPMFPRGQGLVQLSLAGVIPLLPERAYTLLEILAYGVALGWYVWRGARRCPEIAFILALLPLWFAWRSLPSYFAFSALPMMALRLAWGEAGSDAKSAKEEKDTKIIGFKKAMEAFSAVPLFFSRLTGQFPTQLLSFNLRDFRHLRVLRVSSPLVWGLWLVTGLYMLASLVIGHHYCDPQFYQYAGDIAMGKLPYRDVAVEYPPLALAVMILPALPLLPFAGIAPRPEANPHPLHPDPVRYGAYGISFALFMLACDALTLWLVMRSARRLVPGDERGTWSGLLYVILTFASGAVLQKFDLIVGALCLAAVFALLASRDGLAWAALIAATLLKGFPLLLAPLFVMWRVSFIPASSKGWEHEVHEKHELFRWRSLAVDWRALRQGLIGGGIVALVVLVPTLALGGVGGLLHSVAYHTSRGLEIESVAASVVLALGWLPGMGVTTTFDFADLSRDVLSPLVKPLDALAPPLMLLLIVALYALFWYNRQQRLVPPPDPFPGQAKERETIQGKSGAKRSTIISPHDRPSPTLLGRGWDQMMLAGSTAVLLTFILCFRALPLHYVLSIAPLAVLVRLPSGWQHRWLAALLLACVAGNMVIGMWHQLVALSPAVALILIARNAALIAALVVIVYGGLWLPAGSRKKEGATHDIRATQATSLGEREHVIAR